MGTDVASLIVDARVLSGLSARQVAILAGIAPSTVTRIEKGQIDPSVSIFERILAACGFRYGKDLDANIDLDAVRAARRMLEPELNIAATNGSENYVRLWKAAGLISGLDIANEAGEIAFRASQQARLSRRQGSRRFAYQDWKQIAKSLSSNNHNWALTGGYAATFYTSVASVDWAVFYVDDVTSAAVLADLVSANVGPRVTLIPFDELTSAGVQSCDNGINLASYWQIVIDCFAGNGRMPAQAEAMIEKVRSDLTKTSL